MKKYSVAVIGAGGKMGTRIADNLDETNHDVRYVENSPEARERVQSAGRKLTELSEAVKGADVVILAVPDRALEAVTASVTPQLDAEDIVLTLDPAAAYANLLLPREDIYYSVAHPCHPSVVYPRVSEEECADTFSGIACSMDVVEAFDYDNREKRDVLEDVIHDIYSPVLKVHWVTVKQLAQLEPTLAETIACMVGDFLKDALDETVNTLGVPEDAAKAMFYGHVQVALANGLRGDNPFSDACLIAMDYGRSRIIKEDWKVVFDDAELDRNLEKMLQLDRPIER